jgi:hypothetical protein
MIFNLTGFVAPWNVDKQVAGDFLLSKFQLREGSGAVEVSEQGLYYIYAQVRAYEADVNINMGLNFWPHLYHRYNKFIPLHFMLARNMWHKPWFDIVSRNY